jgi:hypothetical protein
MPDWQNNYLSWSFAFAVIGVFGEYVSGILFLVEARIQGKQKKLRESHSAYTMETKAWQLQQTQEVGATFGDEDEYDYGTDGGETSGYGGDETSTLPATSAMTLITVGGGNGGQGASAGNGQQRPGSSKSFATTSGVGSLGGESSGGGGGGGSPRVPKVYKFHERVPQQQNQHQQPQRSVHSTEI